MNKDIIGIIERAARMGAAEVVRRLDPAADLISQRQAFKEFGRAFVTAHEGDLTVIRKGMADNSRKQYSRAELTQLVASREIAMLSVGFDNL